MTASDTNRDDKSCNKESFQESSQNLLKKQTQQHLFKARIYLL